MPLSSRPIRPTDPVIPEDLILQEKTPDPTAGELAGALYRTSWTGGLIDWATDTYASMKGGGPKADPDFVFDMKTLPKKYHPIAEDIMDATSQGEVDGLMKDHDRFLDDQNTIAAAGVDGIFYGGLSAVLDPVTLPLWFMPFGKGFQMAGTLGKMGRLTGLTTAEMAAGEAIMHHIDRSRDPNETRKNLFIAASASSTMGALLGRVARKLPDDVKNRLVDDFRKQAGKKYDEGVILYHGTHPNAVYDIVDLKYVGTGEGKQFQGWGLYMASKYGVARWYAETVSQGTLAAAGGASREFNARVNWLEKLIERLTGNIYTMEVRKSVLRTYLNWSKSLENQTEEVRAILKENNNFGLDLGSDATGHTLYRALTRRIQKETGARFGEAQKEASQILKNAGIKGNSYLDAPSRKLPVSQQTYNHVAFDGNDIRVLKRNKKKINDPTYVGEELTAVEAMSEITGALSGRSVGAMEARMPTEADRVAMEMPLKDFGVSRVLLSTPILRSAFAPKVGLAEPARIMSELTITGVDKAKYLLGIPEKFSPLDFVIQKERNKLGNVHFALKQAKKEILKRSGDDLTPAELRKMVSQASAYPDDHKLYGYGKIYPELKPIIEEARVFRKDFEERMKLREMLDEGVEPEWNAFYGPRRYDVELIRTDPEAFEDAVIAGYRRKGDTRPEEELRERARTAFRNAATLSKVANQAEFPGLRMPMQIGTARLKPISLDIPDEAIEQFLIRDIIDDHDNMIRTLLPEIMLRERYGHDVVRTINGMRVPALEERLVNEFEKKYNALRTSTKKRVDKLKAEGKTEEANKVAKEGAKKADKMLRVHEESLKDYQHVLKKVTGVGETDTVLTGKVAEFLGELRAYGSSVFLGNSALASLHEPITAMMTTGLEPYARTMGVLARSARGSDPEVIEMLRAWGAGMDLRSQHTTAMLRSELDDPVLTRGWKSWGRKKLAPWMYKWNGQNLFNAVNKTGFSQVMQDMIIRHALGKQAAKAGTAVYDTEVGLMAKLGIGKDELASIRKQLDAGHYREQDGSYFANVEDWDDVGLTNRYVDAVVQMGEYGVIGPSAGALPRVLDNQLGKMFTQFRNVFFNMQNKTIVPLAQRLARGDMRTAQFLAASFGMAWMIYQVRMMGRAGWDFDKFEKEWNGMNFQDHVAAAIRSSGLAGLLPDIIDGADNLSEGKMMDLLHMNESTKNYYNKNLGLTGLVPGISWADKVVRGTVGSALTGGVTQDKINGLMYSIPGRTIPYLDPALDAIQQELVSQFPKSLDTEK
jgi:hypothetical protein